MPYKIIPIATQLAQQNIIFKIKQCSFLLGRQNNSMTIMSLENSLWQVYQLLIGISVSTLIIELCHFQCNVRRVYDQKKLHLYSSYSKWSKIILETRACLSVKEASNISQRSASSEF